MGEAERLPSADGTKRLRVPRLSFFASAAAVFALDRLAKCLLEGRDGVILKGVLALTTAHNTGAAMSMLSGMPVLAGVLSLLGLAAVWFAAARLAKSRTAALCLGLIFGGAAGNLLDRVLHGYVIDLFEFLFVRFSIFNVADAAITVGCAMAAFLLLFRYDRNWKGSDRDAGKHKMPS